MEYIFPLWPPNKNLYNYNFLQRCAMAIVNLIASMFNLVLSVFSLRLDWGLYLLCYLTRYNYIRKNKYKITEQQKENLKFHWLPIKTYVGYSPKARLWSAFVELLETVAEIILLPLGYSLNWSAIVTWELTRQRDYQERDL